MAARKAPPPIFNRRCESVADLIDALYAAVKETEVPAHTLPFPCQVRIDLTDGQVLLSIFKRN